MVLWLPGLNNTSAGLIEVKTDRVTYREALADAGWNREARENREERTGVSGAYLEIGIGAEKEGECKLRYFSGECWDGNGGP